MDAQAQNPPETTRSGDPKVFLIVGRITLALITLQFGLAGYAAFAGLEGGDPKDGAWQSHTMVGYLIALLLVVAAVLAVGQRLGPLAVRWTVVAAVLAAVGQPLLATLGEHAAWVGLLHALDGVAIAAVLGIVTARVGRTSTQPS